MRAAQATAQGIRRGQRERCCLRLHVCLMALCTFGALRGTSHALWLAGMQAMAWRHALALPVAYGIYLAMLWAWSHWLLSRDEGVTPDAGLDSAGLALSAWLPQAQTLPPVFRLVL